MASSAFNCESTAGSVAATRSDSDGPLTAELAGRFSLVVLTDSPQEELEAIGEHCHASGVKVVVADSFGLVCRVFVDFGQGFVVHDPTGEAPLSAMVAAVSVDLHAALNTSARPLNTLGEAQLCPGIPSLDKLNASLR